MNLMIRPALAEDAQAIYKLLGPETSEERFTERLEIRLMAPGHYLLVCTLEDRLAGFAALQLIDPLDQDKGLALLNCLCVDRKFRQRDIAIRLEAKIAGTAAANGCGRIRIICRVPRSDANDWGYGEGQKVYNKRIRV